MIKFLCVFMLLFLTSCAQNLKKKSTVDKKLVKKYTKKIKVMGLTSLKLNQIYNCPKHFPKHLYKKNWEYLVSVANSCVQKKKWNMTKKLAEEIFKKEPYSPWGPYYLSLEAESKKQWDRAMWYIDLSIKKMDLGLFHYQKARLYWIAKNYELAEVEFLQSLQLDKNIYGAYLFLGQLYVRDLEYKKAIKYYQYIIEKKGYKKDSLLGLSESHYELKDYSRSLNYINRYLVMNPYHYSSLMRKAYITSEVTNEKELALKTYKKIKDFSKRKKFKFHKKINVDLKISKLEQEIKELNVKRKITSAKNEKGVKR